MVWLRGFASYTLPELATAMIAAHQSVLDEERKQREEEYEEMIRIVLNKCAPVLSEDELRLLQLSCSITL